MVTTCRAPSVSPTARAASSSTRTTRVGRVMTHVTLASAATKRSASAVSKGGSCKMAPASTVVTSASSRISRRMDSTVYRKSSPHPPSSSDPGLAKALRLVCEQSRSNRVSVCNVCVRVLRRESDDSCLSLRPIRSSVRPSRERLVSSALNSLFDALKLSILFLVHVLVLINPLYANCNLSSGGKC